MPTVDPWKRDLHAILHDLSSSEAGLSSKDAKVRLLLRGKNQIPDKDRRSWVQLLYSQVSSPLLLLLAGASLISAFMGDIFDTIIILAILFVSVLLGFAQEYRSERVLSELKKYFSYTAVALRDGERVQVSSIELVPGDIVFVALGDIVPADLRIIETSGISANESVLTGESRPVEKSASARVAPAASSPQEIHNGLFMGTVIEQGFAKALVVSTGTSTFFGSTASVFSSKVPESDFQLSMRRFGSMLVRVIIAMALFVFLSNYLLGHGGATPLVTSSLFALAIAVGIAPEALPAIITATLSFGSMHLARKKVVTKKLAAIEDLGNMDVLCTDKTGTLTDESLRLEKFVDLDTRDSHEVLLYAFVCNSAVGTVHVKGNPIDVAIRRNGLAAKVDASRFRKMQDIPFDYERRRMGIVVSENGGPVMIVKGAPESVLSSCSHVRIGGRTYSAGKKLAEMKKLISSYHSQGFSVIAVAYKKAEEKRQYAPKDEKGLTLLGFALFSNPPKQSLHETFARLRELGIRLKIITGDDATVTKKLCESMHFQLSGGRVVLGSELEQMEPDELVKAVERYDVFARVSPAQKLAIVEALRLNGHVVGFMGDGINDAPALRTADVGISVSTAADVAKGASHIILLKRSLAVVCDGVEEGRRIFGNIMKYILNTMSANQGNMITVTLFSLILPFIPLLPSQILLNNLLSDLPLFAIATDNVDSTYTRKPQKWDLGFIFRFMLFFGLISTIFDILFVSLLYYVMGSTADTLRTGWFLMSSLTEMLIVFSLRTALPFYKSRPSNTLIAASILSMALTAGVVYYGPTAEMFHFVPLGTDILAITAVTLVLYFAATELGKRVFFRSVTS